MDERGAYDDEYDEEDGVVEAKATPDDYKRMLLERAVAAGDGAACWALFVKSNDPAHLRKAADLGDCNAIIKMAHFCKQSADHSTRALANQLYKRLEDLPVIWHDEGASIWARLGREYEEGTVDTPPDLRRAAAMYARLANNPFHSHLLGRLLRDGRGVPRDASRARALVALPSESGIDNANADSIILLAYSFLYGGDGVEVDLRRAKESFKRFFNYKQYAKDSNPEAALWDFILLLLRTNWVAEAAAWSSGVYNGIRNIDLASLDRTSAFEALLALAEVPSFDPHWLERRRVENALRKTLDLPLIGHPRAPPLECLWVSRCGHVSLDAIAAAAFSASGTCPRACRLGAPVTWEEVQRPFLEPGDSFVPREARSDQAGAFADAVAVDALASMYTSTALALVSAGSVSTGDSSRRLICSWPPCLKAAPLKCGRCAAVAYCGPTCQRAHWREHKRACAPAGEAPAGNSPAV